MRYASIGIIALVVNLIINTDVLRNAGNDKETKAQKAYRRFIYAVFTYYVTDVLWGFLNQAGLIDLLYFDTVIYFIVMALGVYLWSRYVIAYLGETKGFGRFLKYFGSLFLTIQLLFITINLFVSILFWFDQSGAYHPGWARYAMFSLQIIMFSLTSINAFVISAKASDVKQRRYAIIGMFGITMAILITVQVCYPLWPVYSIGYLFGDCLLHTFVVEDEKQEYRLQLEEALAREQRQKQELSSAMRMAYQDALTGVKSKQAYLEKEVAMDRMISQGNSVPFAIVVFDLNNLKEINDTNGHQAGDAYIKEACQMICHGFQHSPVYRIGGDEFVTVLENQDYDNRTELLRAFDQKILENETFGKVTVSSGMAVYNPSEHDNFHSVFENADKQMYRNKQKMKGSRAQYTSREVA